MRISENAQERLEQFWIDTHENNHETQPAGEPGQPEEIGELLRLGLVIQSQGKLELTQAGEAEAALAIRRHRLAERLLADVLATEEALIDERACGLEHALFDGIDESICTLLGHPRFCPHGKPIPPGKCCLQMRETVNRLVAPLCELKPGQSGKIAYLQMTDPHRLQKLMAMGVLPGVPLNVLRTAPSYVFEAGYSQFAVDEEIAADIFVRVFSGGKELEPDKRGKTRK
ncbi:MAG: metal-dependent transcriptional regulator [Chloroflexi bacterium]|nr:metal-dependent transcriptional regulator [Chloroflexota bacterium]